MTYLTKLRTPQFSSENLGGRRVYFRKYTAPVHTMGDMQDYTNDSYSSGYDSVSHEHHSDQKMDTPGYDDYFNDGAARASLRTTTRARPDNWPASASEMGHRVAYDSGMGGDDHNDSMLRTTLSTSSHQRPTMWGKSTSEMRRYVDYQQGQGSGDTDSAHIRLAGRMSAPPPSRNGWAFSLSQGRWIKA